MIFKRTYFLFFSLFLFVSCATYSPQFKKDWSNPPYPEQKNIEKSFYLVGDAGLSPMGGMSKSLTAFKKFLSNQKSPDNYTLFLGDNIYPAGMDPEGHPRRKQSENMIDAQYRAVKDYEGHTIFIPGNHEWYNNGPLGVSRQEQYVQSLFGNNDVFKPSDGCGMESIEVTPNIQLVLIDTQWMLEDWNKHPTINSKCDIKTRAEFLLKLKLLLEKNQNKTVILAMHHPMFTNGNHGGHFALAKHLYPLQKRIPMPVVASLVVQIRSQGGVSVQDRYNELYNNFMTQLQEIARPLKRLVLVSGHDHNLQYIERDGFKQIVSGAGSKESYAATGDDGFFSTGQEGFAVLDVFDDGSSWVRYYVSDENSDPVLIFQKEVNPAPEKIDLSKYPKIFPHQYTVPIYKQDSIREALFFTTIWGTKYKDVYSTPVNAQVANLDTLFGGLNVVREMKGEEYNALLLQDSMGRKYRMRAMAKNALKLSRKIVFEDDSKPSQDKEKEAPSIKGQNLHFFTASHPYAEMAIPEMAKAIGVFYTTPHLFYVPKQSALANYNTNFGDALYLISIEPSEKSEGEELFEYPDNVETTEDLLRKIRQTGDLYVDEENYIKSRLFEMLIGDWDREIGHWQWAKYYNRYKKNVYVPIPKNRDHAFSSFEGNILNITESLFSGTKRAHVYDDNLRDLQWFNEEGIILDRAFIRNSGRRQWTYLAEKIQEYLTDEIIDKAFTHIPPEVREETLEDIKMKLKARRGNLVDIANRYYSYLAYQQTVVGTDQDDIFEITRLPEGQTQIRSFSVKNGVRSDTLIDRVFNDRDTKELWIYGLNGNDTFTVDGKAEEAIFIRLIGGRGKDKYDLKEGKRIKVYDYEATEDEIVERAGGTFRFTNVYTLNTYDYRKQIKRSAGFLTAIGYNPDDGFRAAMQFDYRIDNFQRNPFSQKHSLNAAYFTDIGSFEVLYKGEFANIINDLNLSIGSYFNSPNYTVNFFGYGNETVNPQSEKGYGYNRVEVQNISANASLLRNSSFGSYYKLQTTFDVFEVKDAPDLFIGSALEKGKDKKQYFGTIEAFYNYRSHDNPYNPTIGMMFDLNIGLTDNLQHTEDVFGFLKSRIGFYNSLIKSRRLVLKTNVRYNINFGNRFQFYQAANLGGENGLRGFREQRFTGNSFLVGSGDLRYTLPSFKIGLYPLHTGIYGGADLGRVWLKDHNSDKWHSSYGVGLWINGSGGLNANLSTFHSTEGTRLVFGLGFDF